MIISFPVSPLPIKPSVCSLVGRPIRTPGSVQACSALTLERRGLVRDGAVDVPHAGQKSKQSVASPSNYPGGPRFCCSARRSHCTKVCLKQPLTPLPTRHIHCPQTRAVWAVIVAGCPRVPVLCLSARLLWATTMGSKHFTITPLQTRVGPAKKRKKTHPPGHKI